MKKIFACMLLLVYATAYSQDRFIQFDKEKYEQSDTLKISCQIPSYKKEQIHFSSLYLFIENIQTKQHWYFRYPLIDGIGTATLAVDSAMPKGKYAFSFLTRKAFFSIRAKVEKEEDIKLTYSMRTKNNTTFSNRITTDKTGQFSLNGVLFEDSCYFIFLPDGRKSQAGLKMSIVTPLDSSFVSDQKDMRIISIGDSEPVTESERAYQQDMAKYMGRTTLPDVVVSAKLKKKITLFNEQFSSELFKNAAERIFDGLEDDQIARNTSILDFLASRIAGMKITQYKNQYILRWRDESLRNRNSLTPTVSNVDVYVDEVLLDEVTQHFIDPSEVAMIKVYAPPAGFRTFSPNGAITIYTKRPGFENEDLFRNRFKIFGYSAPVTKWK